MSGIKGAAERRLEKGSFRSKTSFSYHTLRSPRTSLPGFGAKQRVFEPLVDSPLFHADGTNNWKMISSNCAHSGVRVENQKAGQPSETCNVVSSVTSRQKKVLNIDERARDPALSSDGSRLGRPRSLSTPAVTRELGITDQRASEIGTAKVLLNVSTANYARLCAAEAKDALETIQRRISSRGNVYGPLDSRATRFCARLASRAASVCEDANCCDRARLSSGAESSTLHSLEPDEQSSGAIAKGKYLLHIADRFHAILRKQNLRCCSTETANICGPSSATHHAESVSISTPLLCGTSDRTDPRDRQPDGIVPDSTKSPTTPNPFIATDDLQSVKKTDYFRSLPSECETLRQEIQALEAEVQHQRYQLLHEIACEGTLSDAASRKTCPESMPAFDDAADMESFVAMEEEDELVRAIGLLKASIGADEVELETLVGECDRLAAILSLFEKSQHCRFPNDGPNIANDDLSEPKQTKPSEEMPPAASLCAPVGFAAPQMSPTAATERRHGTPCSRLHPCANADSSIAEPMLWTETLSSSHSPETHPNEQLEQVVLSLSREREQAEQRAAAMLHLLFDTVTSPTKCLTQSRHTRMIALELLTSQLALKPSGALVLSGDEDETEALALLEMYGIVRSQCQSYPPELCQSPSSDASIEYFLTKPLQEQYAQAV